MPKRAWAVGVAAALWTAAVAGAAAPDAPAPNASPSNGAAPVKFSLDPDIESVYAPPELPREDIGTNEGGVNTRLDVTAFTDYVFRGIDRSESGGAEDSPNLQFDAALKFNLGKWPHPFFGLFTNVYDSDPASRFQEVRPYLGVELSARPITFTLGHSNYIFPDRDAFNTAEFWAKIQLDDSYFFRTDAPIVAPYVFAAYDYDNYHGTYIEFGIRHDFVLEDTPITLSPMASVAFVDNNKMFRTQGRLKNDPGFDFGTGGKDSGFQHYQFGLETTYALNQLLNIPGRFGNVDLKGYLFYTDGIDNRLRANTELYGGLGLAFRY
jgi:hypothetical protein